MPIKVPRKVMRQVGCLWGEERTVRGGWLEGAVDGFKRGRAQLLNIWLRNLVIITEVIENTRRTLAGRLYSV